MDCGLDFLGTRNERRTEGHLIPGPCPCSNRRSLNLMGLGCTRQWTGNDFHLANFLIFMNYLNKKF